MTNEIDYYYLLAELGKEHGIMTAINHRDGSVDAYQYLGGFESIEQAYHSLKKLIDDNDE